MQIPAYLQGWLAPAILFALILIVFKVGKWVESLNKNYQHLRETADADRKNFTETAAADRRDFKETADADRARFQRLVAEIREDIREIREDIKKIFRHLPVQEAVRAAESDASTRL